MLDEERTALAAEVLRIEDEMYAQLERIPTPDSERARVSYWAWTSAIKAKMMPRYWDARDILNRHLQLEQRQNYREVIDRPPWDMEQMRQKYFALARAQMAKKSEAE